MQVIPKTLPAPLRGLSLNENPAFMQPGGAVLLDNWFPTDAAIKLRGGSKTWTRLGTEATPDTAPVQSLFNYIAGGNRRLFAATDSKIYECTTGAPFSPAITPSAGNPAFAFTDGHWSTAIIAAPDGKNYLIGCNDDGNPVIRFDGTGWQQLSATAVTPPSLITGPAGTPLAGIPMAGLTHVWKYRNRLFFIQGGTWYAWYLDIDSVGGALKGISLAGAATLGGSLLSGFAWTASAGDGIDDKCCFLTTEGEVLIFTGSNPGDPLNWSQQGRYQIAKPMGKNAWLKMGGDVLVITKDGIVPISQCLNKDIESLEFSAITVNLRPEFKQEVAARGNLPWMMRKWDEHGGLFVTLPGGSPGSYRCYVANTITGAWCRFTGWDALCFEIHDNRLFFGTQQGRVVECDVGGMDEGSVLVPTTAPVSYVCSVVYGWEVFGAPPNTFTLRQARVSFRTKAREPFVPQVTASVNYNFQLPAPPPPGPDPGLQDAWDEGLWDTALWDAAVAPPPNTRSTYWVSIGETGISHAVQMQVQVMQQVKPDVEMLGVSLIAEQEGVAV